MRTTLDLNDTLLTQAKTRAAKENRTLTSIVEESLRLLLNGAGKPKKIPEIPVIRGTGGLMPGIDPVKIEAHFNALEDEERIGRISGKS
ncbi:MAG TPA: DUF2191 domain-containing protein [Verrucomicrobiae bacterium]|nr:DUF2191 domain-containing protein [Verrucomicrobiae bacterium]